MSNAKKIITAPVAAPVTPEKKTPAPVVVTPRDAFGGRLNTRGHVLNVACLRLMSGGAAVSVAAITRAALESPEHAAYVKLAGRPVTAISNHVRALLISGHIIKTAEGLYTLSEKHAGAGGKSARKLAAKTNATPAKTTPKKKK